MTGEATTYPLGLTCAELRAECARSQERRDTLLVGKLDGIAEEIKEMKELYGRVHALEVWKGNLNGRAAALAEGAAHPHHRAQEETERLHQRAIAAVAAAELAAAAATKATEAVAANAKPGAGSDALPALPRWVVLGVAGFITVVIALALVAGREGLTIWPGAVK